MVKFIFILFFLPIILVLIAILICKVIDKLLELEYKLMVEEFNKAMEQDENKD